MKIVEFINDFGEELFLEATINIYLSFYNFEIFSGMPKFVRCSKTICEWKVQFILGIFSK